MVGCAVRADGKGKHECRLVFHGTKSTSNIDSIMKGGFKLNKVGSATDSGYYGKNSKRQLGAVGWLQNTFSEAQWLVVTHLTLVLS